MKAPDLNSNELLEKLNQNDYAAVIDFFNAYPNPALTNAVLFLEAKQPIYNLAALDCMATSFAHTGHITKGILFASTAMSFGLQLWQQLGSAPVDELSYYLGNDSYLLLKLWFDEGAYLKAIACYNKWADMNLPGWMNTPFMSTHLQAAENHLEHHEIEQANMIVSSLTPQLIPPTSIVLYDRLRNKIRLFTTAASVTNEEIQAYKKSQTITDLETMLTALKGVEKGTNAWNLSPVEELLKMYQSGAPVEDDKVLALSNQLSASLLSIQASMGGDINATSLMSQRYRLGVVMEEIEHTDEHEAKYIRLVKELRHLQQWFENEGHFSDSSFICWPLYICLNRLEQFKEAADELDLLYFYLEEQRAAITDPDKRAGIFSQYPHLFGAMAYTNYQSSNASRLFNRIEASKARSITDKALHSGNLRSELYIKGNIESYLSPILEQNNAHYLSIFCDDDRTYSVLLTKQGRFFATAKGPSKHTLQSWLQKDYPNPDSWKSARAGLFAQQKTINLPLELGVLLAPLMLALTDGYVKEGEHIVFSPDDILNLFSLQYALLPDGRSLIEVFSVSKIHSGFQLYQLLAQPAVSFNGIRTIFCSATQDNTDKRAAFEETSLWLRHTQSGLSFNADIEKLNAFWKPDTLYHLATHGIFPVDGLFPNVQLQNPYFHSGLLLKANNQLPSLQANANYYGSPHLLSPQKLIDDDSYLHRSHISMQACVSGRSKDGYGGDALGMEWAFFQKGVSSIISANWNLDVNWSNKIFRIFYEQWLGHKKTRAKALQHALLQVKKDVDTSMPKPPEYYWAGLSLIGDFR